MRVGIVPLFASAALLATPVFAQTGAKGLHQPSAATEAASTGRNLTKDTEQRIRRSLEESGFKNIQVMPEALEIRAHAPDGSRVVMQMSPDRFAELVAPHGQSSANGTASGTGAGANGSTAMHNGTASGTNGAATNESGSTTSPSGSTSLQSGSSSAQSVGNANIAQQIRQSLQKNGFKDIAVMPEAFLIRGQAPDGSRMVMVISPGEAEGIVAPENRSGTSNTGSGNEGAGSRSGTGR